MPRTVCMARGNRDKREEPFVLHTMFSVATVGFTLVIRLECSMITQQCYVRIVHVTHVKNDNAFLHFLFIILHS